MSSFEDQLQTDIENVFLNTDEFSETVTYTQFDGTTKSIPVVFRPDVGAEDTKGDALFLVPTNATLGISNPLEGERITRSNGDIWTITKIRDDDEGIAECRARNPETHN